MAEPKPGPGSTEHSTAFQASAETGVPSPSDLHSEIQAQVQRHLQTIEDPSDLAQEVSRLVLQLVRNESFEGPIPSPRSLVDYEQITPGLADRIVAMAEREQQHRHSWEQRSLTWEFTYSALGLLTGFGLALGLVLGAYLCSVHGHDAVAAGFLAAGAAGMVTTLVRGGKKPSDKT